MTGAQQAIDSAITEAERLHKSLNKSNTAQVWSDDEKQAAKATALAYFNSHRKIIVPVLGDDQIKEIDAEYRLLIECSGRATVRSKYVSTVKSIRKRLMQFQSDHAVTLAADLASTPATTADTPPMFSPLVLDVKMQTILANRWLECSRCVDAGAPLAAAVMMGGLLEGLLLARILQLADKTQVVNAACAPKDSSGKTRKLPEWGLKDYIDVAHEIGWISKTTRDVGEVVRDYRNFIHPQKEQSHGITISVDDARTLWEIAKSVMRQVLK